jgi:hypothetical protein
MNESDEIYALAERVTLTARKSAKLAGTGETPSALHPDVSHFPLSKAVLCVDCENVSNGVVSCPACGSKSLMNLSKALGGGTGGTLDGGGVGSVRGLDTSDKPRV